MTLYLEKSKFVLCRIQIWRWFVYQKRPLKERHHDGHSNWCFGLCGLGRKFCRRACPRAGSDGQDRNFAFAPAATTVRAGTKVLLVNRDDVPHLVVLANGKARSKALDTDDSFAFVFDKPGEFIYFCGLHPQMKGKIIVTP